MVTNCHVCQAWNTNTGASSALPSLSSHSDLMDNGSEEQATESFFSTLNAKSQCLKHLLRRYPYVSKARARDCLPLAVHGRVGPAKDDVEISGSIQKQKHVKDWTAGFMFCFPSPTAAVQLFVYENQRWKPFDRRYDNYEGGPVLESLQPIRNPYELVEEPYYRPGLWTHFRNYGPTFTIMDTVCRAPSATCSFWALPSSSWIIFFLLVLLRTMNHPFKSTITSLVRVIILICFPPFHITYLREIFSSSRWANFL